MDRTYEYDDNFEYVEMCQKHRDEIRPKFDAFLALTAQITSMLEEHDREMQILATRKSFRLVEGEGVNPRSRSLARLLRPVAL
jgi:hypothetical protein